jgi:hypothetical protein
MRERPVCTVEDLDETPAMKPPRCAQKATPPPCEPMLVTPPKNCSTAQ